MASTAEDSEKESASATGWRLLYGRARRLMAQEEYASAADILRMLVLAAPGEPDVWNALAACHEAEGRTDIGETLRSLSWLVHSQLQTNTRTS
jgi:Flp pilus assembly protein TadD